VLSPEFAHCFTGRALLCALWSRICPVTIAMARRLRRVNRVTHKRMSLRKISDCLTEAGHLNECGKPYDASSIALMLRTDEKVKA
jgi:hypothetical protein